MRTALLLLAVCLPALPARAGQAAGGGPVLSREDFNRLAVQNGVPLYWAPEAAPGPLPSPAALLPVGRADISRYAAGGALTREFEAAYRRLVQARRLEAVRRELDQGLPVLIHNDFRKAPRAERALARHLSAAARIIDELYEEQKGSLRLRASIPAGDAASRALFERNHGPWCEAPLTEDDPFCSAVPSFPQKLSDAYPKGWEQDAAMCESLRGRPDGRSLLDPFTVVRLDAKGESAAASLVSAYGARMRLVAAELRRAEAALGADEAVFQRYLRGAAAGFEGGDWAEADEAWAAMNGRNSRWYLRVAPDETSFEACQEKAGFHLAWARIDQAALAWQDRLAPLRQELEDSLAALIGPRYQARKVAFKLPDFIEVVLNAGDSRPGLGAISGQSLPNWGKVAREGRRRTMVMSNIGADPESRRIARRKAEALLAPEALAWYTDDREPGNLGVILHEAAHNLGPHTDSLVDGKSPSEIFGGRLDGVLEELKAQTAALWYIELLKRKGIITADFARQAYVHEIAWAFGHIALGMFSDGDNPKPYSQLAAVQIGTFLRDGAMGVVRTGGRELFSLDFEKLPASVERLMRVVGRIKAEGDAAAARALVDDFVAGEGSRLVRLEEVQSRLRRFPKSSYSYTVRY
ncbi:MAG: hypothetical protein HY926_11735 [Elusimicrobia bacterium]|nr:hypothetical protein [Elusimicrobiota bacterium]